MHSAEILNYIVYYIVSQHFETRGRQEHHQIMLDVLKWIKVPETCSTVYKLRVSRKHLKNQEGWPAECREKALTEKVCHRWPLMP